MVPLPPMRAQTLGYPAKIFVPELAGPSKIALIEQTGADLSVVPGEYANALTAAQAHEAETGAMQIHAYDAPATVAGQGTCFAEWEAQGLQADTVLIAVGGGGLIAGALAWLQGARKVVAVEPETSCALNAALQAGAPVDVTVSGIAANALGARRIGSICFELAQGMTSVLVTDEAISEAQKRLWAGASYSCRTGGGRSVGGTHIRCITGPSRVNASRFWSVGATSHLTRWEPESGTTAAKHAFSVALRPVPSALIRKTNVNRFCREP